MSKKQLVFGMVCLFITSLLHAQDWSGKLYKYGEKYEGYIIKNEGDTVKGFIECNNSYENQNKVEFYTDPKNKKTKVVYKADDIKGYHMGDKTYRSINYSGGLLPKPLRFNLLIKDGHIARYTWYERAENWMMMVKTPTETEDDFHKRLYPEKEIFKKGDEKPFDNSNYGLKFAKFWAEQTKEDADLSAKIAAKEKGYGMLKMYEIVDEYNEWWAKNKK